MGRKCSVLNLGQYGKEHFVSSRCGPAFHVQTNTWRCIAPHCWWLAIYPPLGLSPPVQFVDVISSASLRLPLFLFTLLSLLVPFRVDKIHVAHTVHKIAWHCMPLWTFSLFPPHTHAFLYTLSHTEKFPSLFTVCFAFEQGVRLSNGREEGTHVLVSLQQGLWFCAVSFFRFASTELVRRARINSPRLHVVFCVDR